MTTAAIPGSFGEAEGSMLRLTGVRKEYGATVAVADVHLEIRRGSVHGLVGENGAGKSTLGKLIAGLEIATSGTFSLFGEDVRFRSPHDALRAGVAMVSQEVALVPERSVLENIFLGRDFGRSGLSLSQRRAEFSRLSASTGFTIPRDVSVSQLNIADQQKVEILRALGRNARVIVFDEPTAALSTSERIQVRETIRRLAGAGVTIVYVSHHLEEVLATCDEITVMRDGHAVSTRSSSEATEKELVAEMLGRSTVDAFPPRAPAPREASAVSLRGVTTSKLDHVDLQLRRGEILGIAGLLGSGRTSVGRVIGGSARIESGTLAIDGVVTVLRSPAAARRRGIAAIAENRATLGLFRDHTVLWNIVLPHLGRFTRAGILSIPSLHRVARDSLAAASGQISRLEQPVGSLSGGNQQKVLIARALLGDPTVLVADEPTRGVDIGAKREIYDVLVEFASRGGAVLLISSELEEVRGLAHRIVVMRQGAIAAEFAENAPEEELLEAAFGLSTKEANT